MTDHTDHLSLQEAYLSMFEFIVELYKRTKSDDLGAILGDLSLLPDGTTADPAAWNDWLSPSYSLGRWHGLADVA